MSVRWMALILVAVSTVVYVFTWNSPLWGVPAPSYRCAWMF